MSPSTSLMALCFNRKHCLYWNVSGGKAIIFNAASPNDEGRIDRFARNVSSIFVRVFLSVSALFRDPRRCGGISVQLWVTHLIHF